MHTEYGLKVGGGLNGVACKGCGSLVLNMVPKETTSNEAKGKHWEPTCGEAMRYLLFGMEKDPRKKCFQSYASFCCLACKMPSKKEREKHSTTQLVTLSRSCFSGACRGSGVQQTARVCKRHWP